MNTEKEIFPVVDEYGNQISTAPREVCHDGKSMLLHPVVHAHIFNSSGRLFLQKRAMTKDLLPGKWDTSVGGHFRPGEKPEDALRREIAEETGLNNLNCRFVMNYIWSSPRERELVYVFITQTDDVPVIDKNEIDEGRFWTIMEIEENLGKGIFTPNFEHEFNLLKKQDLIQQAF
ncbi:MAG: NUDIX domain-containing protein [Bacteroidales bacterium]|nr:NUDIX domain-containing protein [Bacteroidales bacterium]